MKTIIEKFIKGFTENTPDRITNEFNVQFYLGVELLANGFNVMMEHNAATDIKKVMDILCLKEGKKYGIEIKCPLARHEETLEAMRGMEKDIYYIKELVRARVIDKGYAIALTDNCNIYDGKRRLYCDPNNKNLYQTFRNEEMKVECNGYKARWNKIGKYHYYIIEI